MNEYPPEVDLLLPPVIHPTDAMDAPFSHVEHHNRLRFIAGDHEVRIRDLERAVSTLTTLAYGLVGAVAALVVVVLFR